MFIDKLQSNKKDTKLYQIDHHNIEELNFFGSTLNNFIKVYMPDCFYVFNLMTFHNFSYFFLSSVLIFKQERQNRVLRRACSGPSVVR